MKDSSCKYCTDEGECILENKTCDGCMIDYQLECGKIVKAKPNSCLFCRYCTDLFYDWGGVYLTVCAKQKDIVRGSKGKCKAFKNE